MSKSVRIALIWGWGLLLMAGLSLRAFELVPMSMDFDPAGRGATRTFRLDNAADESVPVQISIVVRKMDLDGKETYTPADDDFAVYPPQAVVAPKQSQAVRVGYLGRADLKEEAAYRIIAEQLPVNLSREQGAGGRVNLVLRYLGTIYVVPKGVKPDVVLESVSAEPDQDGKRKLVVVLHNRGNAHTLLGRPQLEVTVTSPEGAALPPVRLEGDLLKGLTNENMLAGHKRRFVLPWPETLPAGSVKATFEYVPQR